MSNIMISQLTPSQQNTAARLEFNLEQASVPDMAASFRGHKVALAAARNRPLAEQLPAVKPRACCLDRAMLWLSSERSEVAAKNRVGHDVFAKRLRNMLLRLADFGDREPSVYELDSLLQQYEKIQRDSRWAVRGKEAEGDLQLDHLFDLGAKAFAKHLEPDLREAIVNGIRKVFRNHILGTKFGPGRHLAILQQRLSFTPIPEEQRQAIGDFEYDLRMGDDSPRCQIQAMKYILSLDVTTPEGTGQLKDKVARYDEESKKFSTRFHVLENDLGNDSGDPYERLMFLFRDIQNQRSNAAILAETQPLWELVKQYENDVVPERQASQGKVQLDSQGNPKVGHKESVWISQLNNHHVDGAKLLAKKHMLPDETLVKNDIAACKERIKKDQAEIDAIMEQFGIEKRHSHDALLEVYSYMAHAPDAKANDAEVLAELNKRANEMSW